MCGMFAMSSVLHWSWRKPNSCRALVRQVTALHSLHPNKQKQGITDRQSGTKALREECTDTFQHLKEGQFVSQQCMLKYENVKLLVVQQPKKLHCKNLWLGLDLTWETTTQRQTKSKSLSWKTCNTITRSQQNPGSKDIKIILTKSNQVYSVIFGWTK